MDNKETIKKQFLEAAITYYSGDKKLTEAIGKTTCFEDLVDTVSNSDFREREKKWRDALYVVGELLSADERQEIISEAFRIIEEGR